MSFFHPWWLVALPLVLWLPRRRGRAALTVSSIRFWPDGDSGKARFLWLPPTLQRLAMALIVIALARPQAGSTYDVEVNEGIAIELLVDISSSMDMNTTGADGSKTTRMEMAREMVARFIVGDGKELKGRPHDLIGLITFARYADTRSPLTTGHDALLQIVRHLEVQDRPNEDGTAYGDALAIAAARLKNPESLSRDGGTVDMDAIKSRVIVLLTDGENNSGAHLPLEAAGLAKEWDCRIYTISLSDPEPAATGDLATTDLAPADRVLEHISEETGGIFRKAHDFESLREVYAEIDRLERSEISTRGFNHVAEWFWLPLALAAGCLLLALILEATWLRVVP